MIPLSDWSNLAGRYLVIEGGIDCNHDYIGFSQKKPIIKNIFCFQIYRMEEGIDTGQSETGTKKKVRIMFSICLICEVGCSDLIFLKKENWESKQKIVSKGNWDNLF